MRLLVLCSNYPDNNGSIGLNYAHVRNVYYKKKGHQVTVLNFNATKDYVKDGVPVITKDSYLSERDESLYDLVICHAANIKYHYRFLTKEKKRFRHIVFFYHGHEVMKLKDYPNDYSFIKGNRLSRLITPIYDSVKLALWKYFITRHFAKIELVFVSEWMRDTFLSNIHLNGNVLSKIKLHVIYNCISNRFEEDSWNNLAEKKYDFVTIRGNIDTSKFAIDFVNQLAFNNPQASFLIVGKGEFFKHYKKAPNITRIEKYMNQDEIVETLNASRCALMPTRLDAQGVMACEMATFGIPVITSDIPVCRYVLDGFSNVRYIQNEQSNVDLLKILSDTPKLRVKNERFFEKETVQKELELYMNICNQAI